MAKRALVLGAGGHAAAAWEIGVLTGLADEGIDVRDAEVLVGTSAGARVAVALANGRSIRELHDEQLAPDNGLEHTTPEAAQRWHASMGRAREAGGPIRDQLVRIGRLDAEVTVAGTSRRDILASSLPLAAWPSRDLRIVAVDADRGEREVLRAGGPVPVLDAVEASCAVAGLFPLVRVDGRRFMDGGTWSVDNADVAIDCDVVLLLTLRTRKPPMGVVTLEQNLAKLHARGVRVEDVRPDDAAETAFAKVHGNVLDPAVREGALHAGRVQGKAIARLVANVWT